MSQVEPVFCHSGETLRLVRVVRQLDEALRRTEPEAAERVRKGVRELIERGRSIAEEGRPA